MLILPCYHVPPSPGAVSLLIQFPAIVLGKESRWFNCLDPEFTWKIWMKLLALVWPYAGNCGQSGSELAMEDLCNFVFQINKSLLLHTQCLFPRPQTGSPPGSQLHEANGDVVAPEWNPTATARLPGHEQCSINFPLISYFYAHWEMGLRVLRSREGEWT